MSAAISAAVVGAVAATYSVYNSIEQGQAAKKANRQARRQEAVQKRQNTMRALQQNRIQAAQVENQAGQAGVSGTSAVAGALGGLQSGFDANLGFANQLDALNAKRIRSTQRINTLGNNSQIAGSIASIADSAATIYENS